MAVFAMQRGLVYFPPEERGAAVPAYPFEHAGERLIVSHRPGPGGEAVLYLGGNAVDASHAVGPLAAAFPGRAVHALHYRGYGGSSGRPTERALVADALALFDHLGRTHPRITVVGRSLGSGIAVQVAAQRPVERLVLVTPYDSLVALGARQFPWLPVGLLMRERYESWRYAPQVRAPVTIVAAQFDTIVPAEHTHRLADAFGARARLLVLPGTGHNDIALHPAYADALRGEPGRAAD